MGLCPESWMGLMAASQGASGLAAGCGAPHLADVLTHIFNDHLISCDGFHGKQTPLVDPAAAESELLLPELEGRRQNAAGCPLNLFPWLPCSSPGQGGALATHPSAP